MKALVAGFGNIFFRDDGYGPEAARLLVREGPPPQVHVTDFGIRGMHAAFEMLEGYDVVLFLDAVQRGGAPGTLYVIEPEEMRGDAPDAHAMELHNALAFYEGLCTQLHPEKHPRILVVGCEPERLDEGIGLSEAVARAVPAAVELVHSVLAQHGLGAHAL